MNDLVSRQAVLRCIKESRENIDWGQSEDGDAFLHYSAALYRTIASEECLPTIEPKRGKWLLHEYPDGYYHTECSECGKVYSENVYFLRKPNYCPNCGAKMERSEDADR